MTEITTAIQRDVALTNLQRLRAKLCRERIELTRRMRELNGQVECIDRRLSDIEATENRLSDMTFDSR
jgi:hypothetical protein